MNVSDLISKFSSQGGVLGGIVNFAEDMTLVFNEFIYWSYLAGIALFVWGVYGLIVFKKPNNQTTGLAVNCRIFFGIIITQMMFWFGQLNDSVWEGSQPAVALGYVEMARSNQEASPVAAGLLAVLALLTMIGVVCGFIALYGFATIGSKQDKHEALWKNTWMMVGGFILFNIMLVASDFAGSFLNISGPVITASSF